MQPIFVEDAIPGYLIVFLCAVALAVCIYSGLKLRDLPAVGYLIPIAYIATMYLFFIDDQPALQEREFFARIGYILLLLDIVIWRIVAILAERKRNGQH